MNYPLGTFVQDYLVSTGRLIQLPCFDDQEQPSDGFRAMVFNLWVLSTGIESPNQVGPDFDPGSPCAVNFNCSPLVPSQLSRIRSVGITIDGGEVSSAQANPCGYLMFNSGWRVPITPGYMTTDGTSTGVTASAATYIGDFLTAVPEFGIWTPFPNQWQGQVIVANFKLDLAYLSAMPTPASS